MPLLIDGNNLLFAAREVDGDETLGRERLCTLLAEWARRRRQDAALVFDGPPPSGAFAAQLAAPRRPLDVRFSGGGVSADDRIARFLADDSAARRILVVSSDREVRQSARRHSARSIRADDFWRALRADQSRAKDRRRAEPREKRRGLSGDALVEWLREFDIPTDEGLTDAEFHALLLGAPDDKRAGSTVENNTPRAIHKPPPGAAGSAAPARKKRERPVAPPLVDTTPHGSVEDFGPDGDALLRAAERMVNGPPDEWLIGAPEDALDAFHEAMPDVQPLAGKAGRAKPRPPADELRPDSRAPGATPSPGDKSPPDAPMLPALSAEDEERLLGEAWDVEHANWPPAGTTPLDRKKRPKRR